jgi:hypothetical protein
MPQNKSAKAFGKFSPIKINITMIKTLMLNFILTLVQNNHYKNWPKVIIILNTAEINSR